jgi:hypothetical protein
MIIPIVKMIGDVYYTFAVYGLLLVTIFLTSMLKLSLKIKTIIISILVILYKKNIFLTTETFYTIIKEGYINSLNDRKDDKIFRDIVYKMFNTHLKLKLNFSKLPNKPTIFVCNYCSDRLENLACILIPKNLAILMRDTLKKISKLHRLIKWPIYTKAKNSYENTKNEISKNIKEGRSIFAYVTKTPRLGPTYIQDIRSGMFKLAKELNIPVTLMSIDYIDSKMGMIQSQNFHIEIGETFMVNDINESVHIAKKYFKNTLKKFSLNKYN